MYIHEEITNEKTLEQVLQQFRESDNPFILDLSAIRFLSSYAIQDLVETHSLAAQRLFLLIPKDSNLLQILKRESVLGILNIFNQFKDIEAILERKETPYIRGFFPAPLFKIDKSAQPELDRLAEVCKKTGRCNLLLNLRQEFQQRGFILPNTLNMSKVDEEWIIQEASEAKTVLYIIRPDVYGQSLEICQQILTISLQGTLQGEERAQAFLRFLQNENHPILFLNLNDCYGWDAAYAQAYRKLKECKKIYLIRVDSIALDFLFKLKGDIFYSDYEKAYEKAGLILKKQWQIIPNPDAETFTAQPIVEINGYVQDQDSEIKEFVNKFMRIVRRTIRQLRRICLDIRELYRLESKARELTISNLSKWCEEHKVRKSNIIVIATLPRPDYTIQDVIADLYENQFFIVATPEEAMQMHESYLHPRFLVDNSTTASILMLEGNIINEQELNIFQAEVENLLHNALSLASDVSNVLRSPQQTVFFDISKIPCVPATAVTSILKSGPKSKHLTKILLVNEHLEELVRKLLAREEPRNVFCYLDRATAFARHICNILVIAPKTMIEDTVKYFQQIFQSVYRSPQARNTQFRVRFHFDFDRLSARLSHENYDLLIFYGHDDCEKIARFVNKYNRPILELVPKNNWLVLAPHQLEMDCSPELFKQKILEFLWRSIRRTHEHRLLCTGHNSPRLYDEIQNILSEAELESLKNFLPLMDEERYEMIATHRGDSNTCGPTQELRTILTNQRLDTLEFHPYRQWARNWTFHTNTKILEIAQQASDEKAVVSTLELLRNYIQYNQSLLWNRIPAHIRQLDQPCWVHFQAASKKLFTVLFRSALLEIKYMMILLKSEIMDLFQGQLWLGLQPLWEAMAQDVRYLNLEAPLLGTLQTVFVWLNEQSISQNLPWLLVSIEFEEADGLKITLNSDWPVETAQIPESITKATQLAQTRYRLDAQSKLAADGTLEITLQLKNRALQHSILIHRN